MIDPHARLIAALIARAGGAGEVLQACSRPWASATFIGARHLIRLKVPHAAVDALREGLEEHEFAIPGHLVADVVVASRHDAGGFVTLEVEALTIEDR
jgi:hypothetical protein